MSKRLFLVFEQLASSLLLMAIEDNEIRAVVLDPGSSSMKVGYAGDDAPNVCTLIMRVLSFNEGYFPFHCGRTTLSPSSRHGASVYW